MRPEPYAGFIELSKSVSAKRPRTVIGPILLRPQGRFKNKPNQGRGRPVPVYFHIDDKLLGTSRPHPDLESALLRQERIQSRIQGEGPA